MFSSDVDRVTVNVSIVDDQIAENPEQFFADLTLITDNDRVSIAPPMATVVISDNDGKMNEYARLCQSYWALILYILLYIVPIIGFENTTYMTVEDNTVTREVCARVLDPPTLDRTVTVTLQSRDGSAMGMYDLSWLHTSWNGN